MLQGFVEDDLVGSPGAWLPSSPEPVYSDRDPQQGGGIAAISSSCGGRSYQAKDQWGQERGGRGSGA